MKYKIIIFIYILVSVSFPKHLFCKKVQNVVLLFVEVIPEIDISEFKNSTHLFLKLKKNIEYKPNDVALYVEQSLRKYVQDKNKKYQFLNKNKNLVFSNLYLSNWFSDNSYSLKKTTALGINIVYEFLNVEENYGFGSAVLGCTIKLLFYNIGGKLVKTRKYYVISNKRITFAKNKEIVAEQVMLGMYNSVALFFGQYLKKNSKKLKK